jgi:hypothetical protein
MNSTMSARSVELRNLGAAAFTVRFLLFVLKYDLLVLGAWIAWLFGALGGDREAHERADMALDQITADDVRSFATELDRRGW